MLLKEGSENPTDRVFSNADEARRELTPDQVNYFVEHHAAIQTELMTSWAWPQARE